MTETILTATPNPILDELAQWYTDRDYKLWMESSRVADAVKAEGETAERVRDFLLSRETIPPIRFFVEDFLKWRDKQPTAITGNYRAYLKSEQWRKRREIHLTRSDGRCQICNSTHRLNVHHRTYERLGYERFADLIVLCNDCHAKFHDKIPSVPSTNRR